MTEMVTSGSMSGEEKRRDGLLGESDNERRRSQQAPPVLYATALVLDSTSVCVSLLSLWLLSLALTEILARPLSPQLLRQFVAEPSVAPTRR